MISIKARENSLKNIQRKVCFMKICLLYILCESHYSPANIMGTAYSAIELWLPWVPTSSSRFLSAKYSPHSPKHILVQNVNIYPELSWQETSCLLILPKISIFIISKLSNQTVKKITFCVLCFTWLFRVPSARTWKLNPHDIFSLNSKTSQGEMALK